MAADSTPTRHMVTGTIAIKGDGWELKTQVTVPAGPTRMDELLPLVFGLSDAIVSGTEGAIKQIGETISCKKGCGACCHNLVMISEVEARHLVGVLESLPQDRKQVVQSRFTAITQSLQNAGLLNELRDTEHWTSDDYTRLYARYFDLHLPCPFLEDESCSIHNDRPTTCREYLVTSPAENCATPLETSLRRVKLPMSVFNAVARWQVEPTEHFRERTVPLVLIRESPQPTPAATATGPELLQELMAHLTGRSDA